MTDRSWRYRSFAPPRLRPRARPRRRRQSRPSYPCVFLLTVNVRAEGLQCRHHWGARKFFSESSRIPATASQQNASHLVIPTRWMTDSDELTCVQAEPCAPSETWTEVHGEGPPARRLFERTNGVELEDESARAEPRACADAAQHCSRRRLLTEDRTRTKQPRISEHQRVDRQRIR